MRCQVCENEVERRERPAGWWHVGCYCETGGTFICPKLDHAASPEQGS